MKILLLGANGQLGSDLVRAGAAAQQKMELLAWTRRELDLRRLDAIAPALDRLDVDAVVNCAAFNGVDQAETCPREAMRLNAQAVGALARSCRQKGIRLVHISTDFVFDGAQTVPYREEDWVAPLNLYGASKALGELLARLECPDTLILRTASLFGAQGSRQKGGNFVEAILQKGRDGKTFPVLQDVVMSPTATADLAGMILTLLQKKAAPGVYHAVNSGHASWHEFAGEILSLAGIGGEAVPATGRDDVRKAKRPSFSALDNSKITSVVGEIPHWKEALRRYLHAK